MSFMSLASKAFKGSQGQGRVKNQTPPSLKDKIPHPSLSFISYLLLFLLSNLSALWFWQRAIGVVRPPVPQRKVTGDRKKEVQYERLTVVCKPRPSGGRVVGREEPDHDFPGNHFMVWFGSCSRPLENNFPSLRPPTLHRWGQGPVRALGSPLRTGSWWYKVEDCTTRPDFCLVVLIVFYQRTTKINPSAKPSSDKGTIAKAINQRCPDQKTAPKRAFVSYLSLVFPDGPYTPLPFTRSIGEDQSIMKPSARR